MAYKIKTLKNVLAGVSTGGGVEYLADLYDVEEINKVDEALMMYDQANNMYQIDLVTLDMGEY